MPGRGSKRGCYKVKEDELKAAWPALHAGDMVRAKFDDFDNFSQIYLEFIYNFKFFALYTNLKKSY